MRTFVAILCAAFAGLAVIGAMSSVASHDSGDAMFLGLLGGAAAMGAALAFRRPTEAERLARQAKRDARREARLARQRQADPDLWKKLVAIAVFVAFGMLTKEVVRYFRDGGGMLAYAFANNQEPLNSFPPLTGQLRLSFVEGGVKTCTGGRSRQDLTVDDLRPKINPTGTGWWSTYPLVTGSPDIRSKSDPVSLNGPPETYCRCFMNDLADSLSNKEADAMKDADENAWMNASGGALRRAAQRCRGR